MKPYDHHIKKDQSFCYSQEVVITRSGGLMKKPGKKGIYPLDKQLRLKPYQRFSALLMKKVAKTATSCVYRKTADIVNRFTLTNLSHQTVKHIVMQSGTLCQEWQDIQRQETSVEETEAPVVYIEGDGLVLRGQHKKQLEIHWMQDAGV